MSPPTLPRVILPLAVFAVTSAATSSIEASPLAVLKSTSPTGPLISRSAEAVATATWAPSGTSTRTVTALRRRRRTP